MSTDDQVSVTVKLDAAVFEDLAASIVASAGPSFPVTHLSLSRAAMIRVAVDAFIAGAQPRQAAPVPAPTPQRKFQTVRIPSRAVGVR